RTCTVLSLSRSSYLYFQSTHFFFFFNPTAPTEIYTLSLHDALPISCGRIAATGTGRSGKRAGATRRSQCPAPQAGRAHGARTSADRKSTRLNSSHLGISYAVFCLKKKKNAWPHAPTPPVHPERLQRH